MAFDTWHTLHTCWESQLVLNCFYSPIQHFAILYAEIFGFASLQSLARPVMFNRCNTLLIQDLACTIIIVDPHIDRFSDRQYNFDVAQL